MFTLYENTMEQLPLPMTAIGILPSIFEWADSHPKNEKYNFIAKIKKKNKFKKRRTCHQQSIYPQRANMKTSQKKIISSIQTLWKRTNGNSILPKGGCLMVACLANFCFKLLHWDTKLFLFLKIGNDIYITYHVCSTAICDVPTLNIHGDINDINRCWTIRRIASTIKCYFN